MKLFYAFLLTCLCSGQDIVFDDNVDNDFNATTNSKFCYIPTLKEYGLCKPVSKCQAVIKNRQRFQFCNWDGNMPKVCCSTDDSTRNLNVVNARLLSVQSTIKPLSEEEINGRRVSVAKCDQYKEAASPYGRSLIGISLISRGFEADPGEFPHMALIGWSQPDNQTLWRCGGSIISENFILTSGHCTIVDGIAPDIIRIGEYDLRSDDDNKNLKEASIKQIITHPNFTITEIYNDLALIEINGFIRFRRDLRPACLHQDVIGPAKVIATGWGQIEFGGITASILQKVNLNFVNHTVCAPFYPETRKFTDLRDTQLCYGDLTNSGGDTCQGDSGGPIQIVSGTINDAFIYDIVGVTSFGTICGFNAPGIYTKVSAYTDWIESVAWTPVKQN